jgi:CYTH domain-containing protein
MLPKYARLEIERRWLVQRPVTALVGGASWRDIEDRYLAGTRLRLRTVVSQDDSRQWKFCKKYGASPGEPFEPIANLYLSEAEHAVLAQLPATVIRKRRYRVAEGSLDVYTQPAGVVIFEAEFESEAEARAFEPPFFVEREVTGEEAFSGPALGAAGT